LVNEYDPALLAVCDIDAGSAYALATRFVREWVYRGRQALFWTNAFTAGAVHDFYLPFAPGRPFDRRGLLQVDGSFEDSAFVVFATQIADGREGVPELRFVRHTVRAANAPRALAFAQTADRRIGLRGLGFEEIGPRDARELQVYARGLRGLSSQVVARHGGLGAAALVTVVSS
jgi:hypothetical protein